MAPALLKAVTLATSLQAGLFFGYMLLVSLGVALVAGAAGFLASLKFLAYIFAQIKFD